MRQIRGFFQTIVAIATMQGNARPIRRVVNDEGEFVRYNKADERRTYAEMGIADDTGINVNIHKIRKEWQESHGNES